ncbi:MAG: hypothetical protein H8D26_06815 [Methanomicrobia archaeon]|nr:hypothetical protein [Methanomicrobia archaeon]
MEKRLATKKEKTLSTYSPLSPQRTRRVRKIIHPPANAVLQNLDNEVDQQIFLSFFVISALSAFSAVNKYKTLNAEEGI